jgi:hypothetical protein
MTNIQYGLDEMGYAITVIDINSFKSVTGPEVPRCSRPLEEERDAGHRGGGERDNPLLDIICVSHH